MLKLGSRGQEVKKLQYQLNSLGYRLIPDGAFGKVTMAAVMEFQESSELSVDGIVGQMTFKAIANALYPVALIKPSTEHFSYEEFIAKNDFDAIKNGIPQAYWVNVQKVMTRMEMVRKAMGNLPIVIRSGYRSSEYNRQVGGTKNSQHLLGKAVDVYVKDYIFSCYDLAETIYFNEKLRGLFGGYGFGSDTNLHLDIRKRKNTLRPAVWWYSKKSWKEWSK